MSLISRYFFLLHSFYRSKPQLQDIFQDLHVCFILFNILIGSQ